VEVCRLINLNYLLRKSWSVVRTCTWGFLHCRRWSEDCSAPPGIVQLVMSFPCRRSCTDVSGLSQKRQSPQCSYSLCKPSSVFLSQSPYTCVKCCELASITSPTTNALHPSRSQTNIARPPHHLCRPLSW